MEKKKTEAKGAKITNVWVDWGWLNLAFSYGGSGGEKGVVGLLC